MCCARRADSRYRAGTDGVVDLRSDWVSGELLNAICVRHRTCRGLIAAAWFHDPRAEEENPHLAALNGPYREHGGLIVPLGPAGLDSGVLAGNAERRRKVESGEVSYRIHVAIWPRDAAIAWAHAHPECET